MMFRPRNDGLAGGGGRGGARRGAGELGPVQLCRRRLSHSCPPPPAPTRVPAATPRSQPPEEHKAQRGQRPRHPGARPRQGARGSAGGWEPRSQLLSSLAHSAGGLAGQRAGRTRDARPLTVRTGLRAPIPPGDSLGSTAGAHRGRGAPPGQPQGCIGSNWRRFLLFLSSRHPQPPSPPPGKKEKKKKKSWAAVAGKSLLSHLPAPLSLPSPRQVRTRQRRRPGPAARILGACSGRWPPGREPGGCFLSPSESRAPRRDTSPLRGPEKAKA
ncbi:collagen alpha-1(I) chain-like [Ovis canadensis]|uniref:collagen alpha-1(I) chain-like n=1 Tax=Ovis canadensis TaxID=37174 RepID=UPI003752EFA1